MLLTRIRIAPERAQVGSPKRLFHRSPRRLASVRSSLHPSGAALAAAGCHRQSVFGKQSLENTLEYFIDGNDAPECASNTVVRVNAVVQMSTLLSARNSPNPFIGVRFVGTFSAEVNARNIFPFFQAPIPQRP